MAQPILEDPAGITLRAITLGPALPSQSCLEASCPSLVLAGIESGCQRVPCAAVGSPQDSPELVPGEGHHGNGHWHAAPSVHAPSQGLGRPTLIALVAGCQVVYLPPLAVLHSTAPRGCAFTRDNWLCHVSTASF